jgi:hypothetical protein
MFDLVVVMVVDVELTSHLDRFVRDYGRRANELGRAFIY